MEKEEKNGLIRQGRIFAFEEVLKLINDLIGDSEGYIYALSGHASDKNLVSSRMFEEGKMSILYRLGHMLRNKIEDTKNPEDISDRICRAMKESANGR